MSCTASNLWNTFFTCSQHMSSLFVRGFGAMWGFLGWDSISRNLV